MPASDIYNTGQSNVNNAANTGKNAIGAFDPNDWQKATMGGYSKLWDTQNSTQNDYITAFKNQIAGQPSATDYYDKGMDAFNVRPLQNTANQMNNTMLNTPNSNLQAARGFNVDANQVNQKTSQDLQRLAPAAAAAQNNATTAQGNAMNYAGMGMQQNQMNIVPFQEQGQYLMDAFARQQSGFSSTQEQQLKALTDKMSAGVQLSAAEMQSYTNLSQMEATYQASLNSANTELQKAKIAAQNQVLPVGSTYFNPLTKTAYNPFATPARP